MGRSAERRTGRQCPLAAFVSYTLPVSSSFPATGAERIDAMCRQEVRNTTAHVRVADPAEIRALGPPNRP